MVILMNGLKNIDKIIIPTDIILDLVDIYKYIGKNDDYYNRVENNYDIILEQTIERDTYFLASLADLDLSDTRMRLIITKNSKPRTKEEAILANIKEVVKVIHRNSSEYIFNSSDLLAIANKIYDKNSVKFASEKRSRKTPLASQALRSKRVVFDEMVDEYSLLIEKEIHERIFLSTMFFVDFINYQPFTDKNEITSYLALYYLLLRCNVDVFKYISFFESWFEVKEEFQKQLIAASFNWEEGFPQVLGLFRVILKMIKSSYHRLEDFIKEYYYEEKINKADNVENTIYKLPNIFSKEDIKMIHPYISESTINRTLAKLRDENKIRPLGRGRSAKWCKIIEEDDFEHIFRG